MFVISFSTSGSQTFPHPPNNSVLTPITSYESLTAWSEGFDAPTVLAGHKNIRAERWQTHTISTHIKALQCVQSVKPAQVSSGQQYSERLFLGWDGELTLITFVRLIKWLYEDSGEQPLSWRGLSHRGAATESTLLKQCFLLLGFKRMLGNFRSLL